MKENISILFKISKNEDYYGRIWLVNAVIIALALLASWRGDIYIDIFTHLGILIWVSLSSSQIFSLHKRKNTSFLLYQTQQTRRNYLTYNLLVLLLQVGVLLVFLIAQAIVFLEAKLYVAIICSAVHVLFAISSGALVGSLLNGKLLYTNLIIFSFYLIPFFFLGSNWPDIELLHIISPTVQLLNMQKLNTTNTLSLLFIAMLCLCISSVVGTLPSKFKKAHSLLSIMVYALLVVAVAVSEHCINISIQNAPIKNTEIGTVSISHRGISEADAKQYAQTVVHLENELNTLLGLEFSLKSISLDKYYVAHYLPSRMIPFYRKDDNVYINVFSDAMTNFTDETLAYDMMCRIVRTRLLETYNQNEYIKQISYNIGTYVVMEAIKKNNNHYTDALLGYAGKVMQAVTEQNLQYGSQFEKTMTYLLTNDQNAFKNAYNELVDLNPQTYEDARKIVDKYYLSANGGAA